MSNIALDTCRIFNYVKSIFIPAGYWLLQSAALGAKLAKSEIRLLALRMSAVWRDRVLSDFANFRYSDLLLFLLTTILCDSWTDTSPGK